MACIHEGGNLIHLVATMPVININLDDTTRNGGRRLVLQVIIYIHQNSDGTKTFRFNDGIWIVKTPFNEADGTTSYRVDHDASILDQNHDDFRMLEMISRFILSMFTQIFPDKLVAVVKGGRKTKKYSKTKKHSKTKRQYKTKKR
jgi:hypothetical protein